MKCILFVLLWICGMLATSYGTAIGIEEEKANCTEITEDTECCVTSHCEYIVCHSGPRCEFIPEEGEEWPKDCQNAENVCEEVLQNFMITTLAPPGECPREFDAPSFIGGMVLAVVVLGLVFASCKLYKKKIEGYTQK